MPDGELKKLTLTAYKDEKFSELATFTDATSSSVSVMINPEEYTHNHTVSYETKNQPLGTGGETIKYNNTEAETISFKLLYDGTGVLSSPNPCPDVFAEINKLKNVIYKYNGTIHSPNYLKISWGTLLFKCRLTSMEVNYTLFKPNGNPLRAKINLNFRGFIDPDTLNLSMQKESVDLSHLRTVMAGDTLPLLCYRIYGNSAYYLDVARINKLANFRNIKPGDQLIFSPLSK